MDDLSNSLAEAPMARLKSHLFVGSLDMWECAQVVCNNRCVALQLGIAQRKQSEGRKLRMIVDGRLRRPVKLFRQGVRLVAIARLDGECASLDDGEEVEVESECYRERHQQAQAMAEKSHDVHVADLMREPLWGYFIKNWPTKLLARAAQ